MKLVFLILSALVLQSPTFGSPEPVGERPTIVLGQGEQRLIHIPGLRHYSLGNQLIRVLPLPDKEALLLKAVAPGGSGIWVSRPGEPSLYYPVRIEKSPDLGLPLPLAQALGRLTETEVILTGKGVVLRGLLRRAGDAARAGAILRDFPQIVHNELLIAPEVLNRAKFQLGQWIEQAHFKTQLHMEDFQQSLWVRGHIESPKRRAEVERQLLALFPLLNLDIESFTDDAKTVFFRVFLLEVQKREFHNLGLSWPSSQDGAFQVRPWSIDNNLSLDVAIQALEGTGGGRVLSNPELTVRVPGEAELFAGGEIPIRNNGRFYSNVEWKNFGLQLKLKVAQKVGEKVRLDIDTEMSQIDQSISADQVPGLRTNKMKTQVDARFGNPLLLCGLLQEGFKKQAQGLPFLSTLPILGKLFGSEDYQHERSELVVILMPHSSPPDQPMKRLGLTVPRGDIPAPRNWLSPEDEKQLSQSAEYPWNAFE